MKTPTLTFAALLFAFPLVAVGQPQKVRDHVDLSLRGTVESVYFALPARETYVTVRVEGRGDPRVLRLDCYLPACRNASQGDRIYVEAPLDLYMTADGQLRYRLGREAVVRVAAPQEAR